MSLVEDAVVPGFTFRQFSNEPYNAVFFRELSRHKLKPPFPAILCPMQSLDNFSTSNYMNCWMTALSGKRTGAVHNEVSALNP